MDRLIVHNDRIIPLDEAHLSPGQAGLLMGWGVFTTLRLYRGQPFEFHRHWLRMTRDAARLSVPMVDAEETVEQLVVELARANGREEGMARLTFIRNAGGAWAASDGWRATDLLLFTHELAAWPRAHRLRIQPRAVFSGGVFAGAKMLSWAQNSLLLERARADGFDDVLLLNERGQLAECTSANVFLVRAGEVLTPPLSSGCLPGVTREILLEMAPEAGVRLVERELTTADLAQAQEVFISSTTREVAPVTSIAPDWHYTAPGELTLRLEAAFRRYADASLELKARV
ncbi:MAG TPA: aminotransferase class IV [Terriglobia bacterium]|nr:aminotransferase class IV [Terriglobia bacterium]